MSALRRAPSGSAVRSSRPAVPRPRSGAREAARPASLFGSCADQDKPLPIFDTIAAAKPDLLLLIGDNIYADLDKSREGDARGHPGEVRHAGEAAGLAEARRRRARSWRRGTTTTSARTTPGPSGHSRTKSQKLFLDFFGVPAQTTRGASRRACTTPPSSARPASGCRSSCSTRGTSAARSSRPGRTRARGSPVLPNTDPDATMLGAEQWKWLEGQLKQPAEVRLLVSSIQVIADEHPFEKWANFPKERDRLYDLIRRHGGRRRRDPQRRPAPGGSVARHEGGRLPAVRRDEQRLQPGVEGVARPGEELAPGRGRCPTATTSAWC